MPSRWHDSQNASVENSEVWTELQVELFFSLIAKYLWCFSFSNSCSRWKYERSGSSDDQGSTILWYPLVNWSTIKLVKMHVTGVNSLKLNNIPSLLRMKLGLCNVLFVRSARKASSMCCLQLLQKLKCSLTSLYRQICMPGVYFWCLWLRGSTMHTLARMSKAE